MLSHHTDFIEYWTLTFLQSVDALTGATHGGLTIGYRLVAVAMTVLFLVGLSPLLQSRRGNPANAPPTTLHPRTAWIWTMQWSMNGT